MCILTAMFPLRRLEQWECDMNKLLVTDLLLANSTRGNKDGCGFLSTEGSLKKWETAFAKVAFTPEYCDFIDTIVGKPFIAHVRATSTGVNAVEGAHPFVVGHIAVAHNGTFANYRKFMSDVPELTEKDPVDSHVYTHLLAKEAGDADLESKHIVSVLKRMTGSYSMIITDLKTGTLWVVAGGNPLRSKQIGPLYVVNTAEQPLDSAASYMAGFTRLIHKQELLTGETGKLEEYTIYKLNGAGLVKVGDAPKLEMPTTTRHYTSYHTSRGTSYTSAKRAVSTQEAIARAMVIHNILEGSWMTRYEIDYACQTLFGSDWFEVDSDLLETLGTTADEIQRSVTVEKSDLWRQIGLALLLPYETIGKVMDIKFPWPLNTTNTLKEVLRRIGEGELGEEE